MSFAEILRGTARRRGLALPPAGHPEPLAAVDYREELALKQEAFRTFWRDGRLPVRPEPVVPAPVPRGYRTTTKRRADRSPRGFVLSFPGVRAMGRDPAPSALDLPEHVAVYATFVGEMARPAAQPLAAALNWVVIRGVPGSLAVIFNVHTLGAGVVRAARSVAIDLQAQAHLGVRAGFLYLDPTRSEYYLEARRPAQAVSFKRLFGPGQLVADAGGARLHYPPTVFSQVNNAMLAVLIEHVSALLTPLEEQPLLDLYCGYGLFSVTAGRRAARVTGVDADTNAIQAARANATHLDCANRMRFMTGRLEGPFLANRLRPPSAPEVILIDPPRQGTAPDVVPLLAARAPRRVVHLCCGVEEVPREVRSWSQAGYGLERVVPLDLFAGTTGLEILLLFGPRPGMVPSRG